MGNPTSGPWEYGDVLYQRDFRTFLNVVSNTQSAFVACVSADPMHRDTIFANARLIAAAPDYAKAAPDAAYLLEQCADFIRRDVRADECYAYLPFIEKTAAALRAAIARARGGEAASSGEAA